MFVKTFELQEWERIHTNFPLYTIQHYVFCRSSKILDLCNQIYVCVSLCCDILFKSISKSSHVEVFNWWLTKQTDHTSAWVFSCKFAPYFQNPFYSEHLWTAASEFHYIIQQSWEWYTYLEHSGISMMKLFGKIVNGLSRWLFSQKSFIVDVPLGSEYASVHMF